MKKRNFVVLLAVAIVSGFATNAAAASSNNEMVITYPEEGITEGYCVEKVVLDTRAAFVDYVGVGKNDEGPWEHGVIAGLVYSNYTNRKFWHGSSVRGSFGLTRSEETPPGIASIAKAETIWHDGNHAYWRVDENRQ